MSVTLFPIHRDDVGGGGAGGTQHPPLYVGHKTGGGFPTTAPPAPTSRGPGPRVVFFFFWKLFIYVP